MSLIKLPRNFTTGVVPATTSAAGEGETLINVADAKVYMRNASGAAVLVASRLTNYSASLKYAVGDVVIESGVIYQCSTAVTTPEAFNPAKWTATGASVDIAPAVVKAPSSTGRNEITPTGNYTPLTLLPSGGQSAPLFNVNGTQHDARGLPVGRYGETVFLVSQASHPFTLVGQAAAYVHPNWVLAQSGSSTLAVRALVHEVIDANNVLLQTSGQIKSLASASVDGGSIAAGTVYYLSTTAGKLTSTPPTNAQPALLTTSTTKGVILLANAAGASIVSRAPGGAAQTVFEPFRVVSTDGSKGFSITPATQTMSTLGGTPINLIWQESGELRIEGAVEVTGFTSFRSSFFVSNASPYWQLTETDQSEPVGRYRVAGVGGRMVVQRSTTGNFITSEDIIDLSTTVGGVRVRKPIQIDDAAILNGALTVAGAVVLNGTLTANASTTLSGLNSFTRSGTMASFAMSGSGTATFTNTALGTPNQIRMRLGVSDAEFRITSLDADWLSIKPNGRIIDASGSLTVAPATQFSGTLGVAGDLTASTKAITPRVELRRDGDRIVYFMDAGGSELGSLYSALSDDSLYLRVRTSGTTRSQLRLKTDGGWQQTHGYWEGIKFGSEEVGSRDDLTRHLNLYGGTFGLSVSNAALNIVYPASSYAYFVGSGVIDARIDPAGTTAVNDVTVMTREKGDLRYRDASNLNTGTVPVARMPAGASERDRILDLLAGATFGAVGTTALLMRNSSTKFTRAASYAGSGLTYAGIFDGGTGSSDVVGLGTPSGTWMALGDTAVSDGGLHMTMFLRVA